MGRGLELTVRGARLPVACRSPFTQDVILHVSLPARERTLLGQFYTPPLVAELLAALTITPAHRTILDPACGAGELLLAARALRPDATLAGIDIHPAAAAAARDQLRGHATITTGDFFAAPSTPTWDCILANPPYVRSQQQDDRDPAARARLFAAAAGAVVECRSPARQAPIPGRRCQSSFAARLMSIGATSFLAANEADAPAE